MEAKILEAKIYCALGSLEYGSWWLNKLSALLGKPANVNRLMEEIILTANQVLDDA